MITGRETHICGLLFQSDLFCRFCFGQGLCLSSLFSLLFVCSFLLQLFIPNVFCIRRVMLVACTSTSARSDAKQCLRLEARYVPGRAVSRGSV